MENETNFSELHFTKHFFTSSKNYEICFWLTGLPSNSEIDEMVKKLKSLKNKKVRESWTKVWEEEDEKWRIEMEEVNKECKERKSLGLKPKQKGYIYLIKSQNLYKIGRAKNIDSRIKKYITENPYEIEVIFKVFVDDYFSEEEKLLKMFESRWIRGEWFSLNDEDVELIKKMYDESI
jgi:hypothetical protein